MTKLHMFKLEPHRLRLTIDDGVEMLRNLPMENSYKLHIYKGITNTIELSIRNNDRKAVSVFKDDRLFSNFVSHDGLNSFHGCIEPKNPDLGLYTLIIPEEQLLSIPTDTYTGSIIVKDMYGNETPLYIAQDYCPYFDAVVHPNKFETTVPTLEICGNSFIHQIFMDPFTHNYMDSFTSAPFKADRVETHTFMLEAKNFYGRILIEGSTDDVPSNNDEGWFLVKDENYCMFDPHFKKEPKEIGISGNLTFFVRSNVTWMRIKYIQPTDSVSTIAKVYYRN